MSVPERLDLEEPSPIGKTGGFTRTYVDHFDYWPRITDYIGSGDVDGRVVWLDDCREGSMAGWTRSGREPDLAGAVVLCWESDLTDLDALAAEGVEAKIGGLLLAVDEEGPVPRPFFSSMRTVPRSSYASTRTLPFPSFHVY